MNATQLVFLCFLGLVALSMVGLMRSYTQSDSTTPSHADKLATCLAKTRCESTLATMQADNARLASELAVAQGELAALQHQQGQVATTGQVSTTSDWEHYLPSTKTGGNWFPNYNQDDPPGAVDFLTRVYAAAHADRAATCASLDRVGEKGDGGKSV